MSLRHEDRPDLPAKAVRTLICVAALAASVLVLPQAATAKQMPRPATQATAADFAPEPVLDQAFFGFGGAYIAGYFSDMVHPWSNTYYGDYVLGLGYQKLFSVNPDGISYGVEIGVDARFGVSAPSAEVWTGGVIRYDGIKLFDKLRVTPAITAGFSYVTGNLRTEAMRAAASGDSATLLFYLGPELDFSLVDKPEWEVFARIQHRSGLYGTLANIDGANATVIGLRHRF